MTHDRNPFVFEAANNLRDEQILDHFIDDHNHSRFLKSVRNVFLVGERGSGKTMALLYNSWRVQKLRAEKQGQHLPLDSIGIYVPCNTLLTHKAEYQLLDDRLASTVSEHFLVLSITFAFVDTLGSIQQLNEQSDVEQIRDEVGFILGEDLPNGKSVFDSIKQFIYRELLRTQRSLNSNEPEAFYPDSFTLASCFVPLLYSLSEHFSDIQKTHFRLMIDDAHSLNEFQVRSLNSWIAYRDHSRFSFKVATARSDMSTKVTALGGSLLEGHDYTKVDLEAPYHNKYTQFYQLARRLVKRRLQNASIDTEPEEFFPMNVSMRSDLDKLEQVVLQEAVAKFGKSADNQESVRDYVYKYTRARYFQQRSPRANRPPYSGFEMLVFLSTGVVRNLLEPCFWMFERMISDTVVNLQATQPTQVAQVTQIPSKVQTEEILKMSNRKWDWARDSIAHDIDGCGSEDGRRAYQLLDGLAKHFRHRLANHASEPRSLSFTISAQHSDARDSIGIQDLLEILRKAQLLYVRSGTAKEGGKTENYYVPNRILWPSRGLDPHGQHARVSLTESALWQAALTGEIDPESFEDELQGKLWS